MKSSGVTLHIQEEGWKEVKIASQAGFLIGSGTVESACKVVVQERMKQAGMRWGRNNTQAMFALRCALLSDRWEQTWRHLRSPT
jgi:hypothetical protein